MTRYLLTDAKADALAAGGTIEIATTWTSWDWIRWGCPYLATGLALGAIVTYLCP